MCTIAKPISSTKRQVAENSSSVSPGNPVMTSVVMAHPEKASRSAAAISRYRAVV